MAQLKDPQRAIPGGYDFYQPQTKWRPAPFSSLDSITQQLISHRRGRPDLIASCGWSTDTATVLEEVKRFNVYKCQQMGWNDYIIGGGEVQPPFRPPTPPPPSPVQRLRNVAGAKSLVEWIATGAEAVDPELANKRAEVCVACPLNQQGGWESFFTVPVSNAIRRELDRRSEMKLSTPHDEKLKVCGACSCPIPLLVHVPLEVKLKHIPEDSKARLDPSCWILSEETH